MNNPNKPLMLVLSSPSGAGKTTLSKKIQQSDSSFEISVSHTTRKPRANEVQDEDYHFINNDEFKNLIKKNEFLEYAEEFNHFYGTTKTPVINNLKNGKNVIFDIDWQGAEQIKSKKLQYRLITFFVLPPSKEVLFNRLSNRDMKDKLIAEERMKQFDKDILHWKNYDYVVINDNLQGCYNQICKLIESKINNSGNEYSKELILKHIKKLTS